MPSPMPQTRPPRIAHKRSRAALLLATFALASCREPHDPATLYPPGPGGTPRGGGHAIFVREEDPDFVDPGLSYGTYSAPVTEALFRGLVGYADATGAAGARIVPELAASLPDVREGGTLYAFAIRPDARFGKPLHRHITATDFKYAFERQFRLAGSGCGFYLNVVGVRDMLAGRDTSVAGVIARGDSIYYRLVKPDPIFLDLLAFPFTAPVPRDVDTAWPNAYSQHAVATGPFEIAEFTPRRRLLLVRNPDYCGMPALLDTFEMRLGITTTNAVLLIRRGLVDGGMFTVPAAEYARLHQDPYWKHQLDVSDGLDTEYLYMNVRVKPFDDVRVRQAVCWAVDRRALLKVYSGHGIVAGEFLPTGMPGAKPLGRFQGPDVARAKQLLREAGYPHGVHVKLYGMTTEPQPRELALVQQQLAEAGIVADLDLGEAVGYSQMAGDTANRVGFGRFAWTADYVDPSNFFDVLMNGRRIQATSNLNLSMLDDPGVNAAIEQAMAASDDSTRARLWHALDERVTDLAPVAPLLHLYESRLYAPRLGGWYRHITQILKIDRLYLKASPPQGPQRVADARTAERAP